MAMLYSDVCKALFVLKLGSRTVYVVSPGFVEVANFDKVIVSNVGTAAISAG